MQQRPPTVARATVGATAAQPLHPANRPLTSSPFTDAWHGGGGGLSYWLMGLDLAIMPDACDVCVWELYHDEEYTERMPDAILTRPINEAVERYKKMCYDDALALLPDWQEPGSLLLTIEGKRSDTGVYTEFGRRVLRRDDLPTPTLDKNPTL